MPYKEKQAQGDLKHSSSTARMHSWTLLRAFGPHELLAVLKHSASCHQKTEGYTSIYTRENLFYSMGCCMRDCVCVSAGLSTLFGQVVRGMSSGSRVFQYITIDRETHLQCGGLSLGAVEGTVHFKDVQFSYPSRPNQVEKGVKALAKAPHITSALAWLNFLHLAPNLTLRAIRPSNVYVSLHEVTRPRQINQLNCTQDNSFFQRKEKELPWVGFKLMTLCSLGKHSIYQLSYHGSSAGRGWK